MAAAGLRTPSDVNTTVLASGRLVTTSEETEPAAPPDCYSLPDVTTTEQLMAGAASR